jgi:TolB protein
LTNDKAYDDQPALSPDGKSVVFVSNRDGNNELYVIGVNGTGLRRITDTAYPEIDPSFSPDGRWIIYTSMAEGDKDIVRIPLAGGEPEILVTGEGDQFMARMAPDGALVYVENGGDEEIVLYKDGKKKNLSQSPGLDLMPSFSADGDLVYFTSNRGGDYDLFVVNRDGSALKELITLESSEGRAAVSPEGRYLAVASDQDGELDIYIFSLDGEMLEQLTQNEAEDYEPFWGK